MIKLANSRQSTIADSLSKHVRSAADAFVFDLSYTIGCITKAICMHEYPFSFMEHVGMKEVYALMQPTFKVPSRNTIKKDIFEMYELGKLNMTKLMDGNDSRVAITTDMLSFNQEKRYMVVTAHYIDSSWILQMRVLSFTYVLAPHTSEVLPNALMKVLLEWNIDRKFSTITLDNCSTNDAMVDELLGRLDSNLWNSTYVMLETAWLYRNVFPRLRQKDPNYKSLPSNEERNLAKEICDKLKLFYDVTQLFSGTQVPIANIYFNKVCYINVALKKWSASPNSLISNMACSMRVKFDKYWEEIHCIMGIAVILDPRYKLAKLEYKFSTVYQNQNECSSKIERIKQICYDLLHEYQQNPSNSSNTFEDSTQELHMNVEQDDDAAYQLYIRQTKKKVNGARFPTLQRIVRDIFAIPVSTVASESSFSTSGRVIAPHRGNLHEDTVEALMCNQNWLWAAYRQRGEKPDYQTTNDDDDDNVVSEVID
ncbi:hypothetical protein Ahy_A05g025742 [Arachis hypogaea]|uniref:HAT C-terminal dimerisation domain-containing protein n=1 Tax=Arachis hypogaea TaxID=3818 RepID=A0A445D9C2_ARAHY|nr:hypothetical protein Ahy_A05g025742 [Arachis hypogaea]